MILKIDPKYIEDTIKRKNEHGYVYVKYAKFEPRYERRVVKEPIPVIGKIFPFLTRKVVKDVNTGQQDLTLYEEKVDNIRAKGEAAPKMLKETLEKMPYRRIVKLDENIYGDLYVAHMKEQKYNLLTNQGVVLGQFDIEKEGGGYYYPYMNGLLPKESASSMDRHQSSPPIGLEDIVSNYMAKNPDSKEFIPQDLYERFPNLNEQIISAEQAISAEQEVKKSSPQSLSTRDFTLN